MTVGLAQALQLPRLDRGRHGEAMLRLRRVVRPGRAPAHADEAAADECAVVAAFFIRLRTISPAAKIRDPAPQLGAADGGEHELEQRARLIAHLREAQA